MLLTLPVRRARLLRLTRALQLLLSGTVPQTGLLLTRTVLARQSVLLRSAARRVEAVDAGVGAAEIALLVVNAAAEVLRRVKLTHKALIAQHLLR